MYFCMTLDYSEYKFRHFLCHSLNRYYQLVVEGTRIKYTHLICVTWYTKYTVNDKEFLKMRGDLTSFSAVGKELVKEWVNNMGNRGDKERFLKIKGNEIQAEALLLHRRRDL